MPIYTFPAAPVLIDATGGEAAEFAVGATGVLRPESGADAVPIWDLNDSPIATVAVGTTGAHQPFKADIPDGVLDFGSTEIVAISAEAFSAALTVQATADSALSQVETMQVSKASAIHTHVVGDLEATGTPSASTYLRGDGTWATPAGGGGTGFIDGGTATSTFSDTIIDGGAAA